MHTLHCLALSKWIQESFLNKVHNQECIFKKSIAFEGCKVDKQKDKDNRIQNNTASNKAHKILSSNVVLRSVCLHRDMVYHFFNFFHRWILHDLYAKHFSCPYFDNLSFLFLPFQSLCCYFFIDGRRCDSS